MKKKIIIFFIIFLILFSLIYKCNVNAVDVDLETIRHSIVNAFSDKIGSYEYGSINEEAFNKDLSVDHTLVLYFIYNNPTNKYFDIIVLCTGNKSIKTGTNGFVKNNNSNLEHIVYQDWRTSDWRSTVQFKHIIVDYNYNFINYESNSVDRTPIGSYNINTLFNISNATYDNLLMVSPNYKGTFLKIFPDFVEKVSSDILFTKPYIANTDEDLATGNFNYVLVMPGSISPDDSIGIKLNKVNIIKYDLDGDGIEEEHESFELLYKTQLNNYMKDEGASGDLFWYEFPQDSFGVNFKEGDRFCLQLVNDINKIYLEDDYILYQEIYFTIGGLSEDDKANNRVNSIIESNKKTEEAIKNQTEAIKEQTETSKNIFETIKSIVNFLNPFSKDFFVYQLIELLINMLKSLFVPSDDFFSNWFNDLNSWLGDRFGILYFPIEIVLDFLNRIGSMSVNSDYILHIPDVGIDFFGNKLIFISSFDYDFNSLLTNDTFRNLHTIYLTIVDVILYLCLIVLSYNTFVDVFGGHYIDDAIHDGYDYYESNKIENKQHKQSNYIGFRAKGQ